MRRALALAGALCALLPAAALAQERTNLADIESEVMCPVCGTTLDKAGDAPQAERERELIRGLIAQGLTEEQVKDELVAEFGPEVLAVPDDEGFDLTAWIVPVLALAAAAAALVFGLARLRGSTADTSGPELSEADNARLERELERDEAAR